MKRHYQSFFGKKCALIINSNSDNGDFFLNFIQEKENGKWETYKEGLNIKLGLKEICEILYILEKNRGKTNIIHKYKNNQKNFWIGFEQKQNDLVFSIKGKIKDLSNGKELRAHQKSFFQGELRLLKKLLIHIENEFIELTTIAKSDE